MSIYIFFTLGKQFAGTFGSVFLKKSTSVFFLIFFVFSTSGSLSQAKRDFHNPEIKDDNIKTVQFHRDGWPMSYPVIELNSNQRLLLSFDELGTEIKSYYYSVELCDANWQPSMLMRTEYFRGDEISPIVDYQHSFNTTFDYIHYRLVFPNSDASILLSGNYLLRVFENYDEENPVLVQRFMVSEQQVTIEPDIKYTMQSAGRGNFQEIDFEVFYPGVNIMDPGNEVEVNIFQNGRTDNAITGLRPLFFGNDKMDFNYNREVVMEGGNEFRWVDIRSLRFQSDHIADISFSDPFYHVNVFTDSSQQEKPYYYHRDFNGRYYIEVQEEQNPEVSADYAFVHFSLDWQTPEPDRQVFLIGALTGWQLNESSRLKYNYDTDLYNLTLLLKQGYYNYQYLIREEGLSSGTVMPIEGSFGRTENEYLILVYYRPAGARYDRLIGTEISSSMNR